MMTVNTMCTSKKDGDEENVCPLCNVIFYTKPGAALYDEYGCADCGNGPHCPECATEGKFCTIDGGLDECPLVFIPPFSTNNT